MVNDQEREYCVECGDFFPVDEHGDIQCECEHDPLGDDDGKPLNFN